MCWCNGRSSEVAAQLPYRTVYKGGSRRQASSTHQIHAGVPQGSILGPTLFLVYVRDIDECLTPGTRLCTYADDTTLYSLIKSVPDFPDSVTALQTALDGLEKWGEQWRVRFEPAKSQRMVVRGRKKLVSVEDITFGGVPVQETQSLKLLGVTFDSGHNVC